MKSGLIRSLLRKKLEKLPINNSEMFRRKESFSLQTFDQRKRNFSKKLLLYKGLFLTMLSGFLYSSSFVIVKQLTNIHPGQLTMYRFSAAFIFSLPEAIKCQENTLGPQNLRFLLFIRGIFGATNGFLRFLAFRYLPLGEAAVIIFSVPIFVTVAARIFLKEPCGMLQSITVVLTVVGIIFTTKIPLMFSGASSTYSTESIYGLLAAVISLLFATSSYIITRKIKNIHHSIIMLNLGWVGVIVAAVVTPLIGNFELHSCGLQTYLIIILVSVNFIGQTLITMALQCENAGPVSTVKSASDIVFAFMWQVLLFQHTPDLFSIVGALLVGASVILTGLRKWISTLPDDSSQKKKFQWMLI